VGFVPQGRLDGLRRQSIKGGPTHEVEGSLGENRCHVGTSVDQAPTDLDGLVGGDAPGDPENDPASGE
jgi:hypothetical protein